MTKFLAVHGLQGLRPADQHGEDTLRKIGMGELVMVEIRRPRSPQHHRMFWALATLVYGNLDETVYPSIEDFVGALKIAAGYSTRVALPSGEVAFIPRSISFSNMDQDEFNKFYEKVSDIIAKQFLPGVTSDELRDEVSSMIGISNETANSS